MLGPLEPYLLYIKIALFAAALAGAAWAGHTVTSNAWKAQQAEDLIAAEKARDVQEQKITAISAELEQAKAKRDVVYKTITKTVDRIVQAPGYDRVCLDPPGLSAANAALGFPAADSGKPPQPVSKPKPPG